MFKMAKKILTFDGKGSSGSPAGASSGSAVPNKQDKDSGGGGVKKSNEELNDFSKLDNDPRLPLNVRQIFKISKSWKAIARTMSKTGTAMFLNLFEQNQDLFYLFDRFQHLKGKELHESMELREHAATVMATLDQSINSLSDYDNFVTYLHSIGKFHRKVPGFRRAYFWKIEQPFLKAVKQTLDERCNETIEEIYKIAIKLIIETISEGYGEDKTDEAPARRPPGNDHDDSAGNGSGARGSNDDAGRPGAHRGAANNDGDDNSGSRGPAGPRGGGGGPADDGDNKVGEIRLGEGKCASPTPTSGQTTTTSCPSPASSDGSGDGHLHAPGQPETKLGPTLFVLRQLLLTLVASERTSKQGRLEKAAGETGETPSETPATATAMATATKTSRRSRSCVEVGLGGAGSQVGAASRGPRLAPAERGQIGKGCRDRAEATRGSGSLINCQAPFDSSTTLAAEQQLLLAGEQQGTGNGAHNQRAGEANPSPAADADGKANSWKLAELNNKTGGQQINRANSAAARTTSDGPLAADQQSPRQLTTWLGGSRGQRRPTREEMSSNDGVPANLKSRRNSAGMKERSLSIVSRLRIKQSSVKPSDGEPKLAAAVAGNHHFPPPTKAAARRSKFNADANANANANVGAATTAAVAAKLRLSTDPDDLKELIKLLMLTAASRVRQTAAT